MLSTTKFRGRCLECGGLVFGAFCSARREIFCLELSAALHVGVSENRGTPIWYSTLNIGSFLSGPQNKVPRIFGSPMFV